MYKSVPVVDLQDYINKEKRAEFIQQLGDAFRFFGFVRVKGHNVTSSITNPAYTNAKDYFALSSTTKSKYIIKGGAGQRGYTPYGIESAKNSDIPDLKEFWHVGRELPQDDPLYEDYDNNIWPEEVDGFQDTMLDLYDALEDCSDILLEALALYLGEKKDVFTQIIDKGNTILRLLYYPALEGTLTWEDFLAMGDDVASETVFDRLDNIDVNAPATFIYTSGTTGPPKAVMLSHENLTFTADTAAELVNFQSTDSSVSYLPLSHIAEQMFSIHAPITVGSSIYFAESIDKLPDNLKEVQPTVIFGVPRIWEKFHAGITKKLSEATGVKAKIANWAMAVGKDKNALQNKGRSLPMFMKLKYAIAKKLIYSKIKPAIGLGNARVCVSGAAPIAAEILEFFSGLDLVIHEVYGQSEDCGPTTFNVPGKTKYGSVGPAVPGVQVKLAEGSDEEGREIIVKGKNVFLGYYKDKDATDSTLIDGWLYSGDLGKIDKDGFFHIVGRKKEIIITAGGKNIAPKNIESALKNIPLISQAVVIGDRRKFLSALLSLDEEEATQWAEKLGVAKDSLSTNEQLNAYLNEQIQLQVNQKFARVEHIRKFTILPRELSIDDGELTPTLKIKRRIVNSNWAEVIDSMYE